MVPAVDLTSLDFENSTATVTFPRSIIPLTSSQLKLSRSLAYICDAVDGGSPPCSLHLVRAASLLHPAGAAFGLSHPLELVHRLHPVVGVRLHPAGVRAFLHGVTVSQPRALRQLQGVVHRRGGPQDGRPGDPLPGT